MIDIFQLRLNGLRITICLIAILCGFVTTAQENIQNQFDEFYSERTSTWEQYKMIKKPGLMEFWKVVTDTLNNKDSQIQETKNEVVLLKAQIDSLQNTVSILKASLEESEAKNDSIGLLGIQINKSAYNIVMWLIIAGLIGGMISIYLMYRSSNSITKKVQKAYNSLETEFADHRDRSREKQVKLKRELQTALNALQENRINT